MGSEAMKRGFLGWWVALTTGIDLPSRLTSSHYGRRLTMGIVRVLEAVGIAEPGTYRTALMLEHCGLSAALAGQLGIFTPAWLTIARVPLDKDDAEQEKRMRRFRRYQVGFEISAEILCVCVCVSGLCVCACACCVGSQSRGCVLCCSGGVGGAVVFYIVVYALSYI